MLSSTSVIVTGTDNFAARCPTLGHCHHEMGETLSATGIASLTLSLELTVEAH